MAKKYTDHPRTPKVCVQFVHSNFHFIDDKEMGLEGPWIFHSFDFLQIENMENHVPISLINDSGIGNHCNTSFNGSKASPLALHQIQVCRRGASVVPRPWRLVLCPYATA